MKFPKQIYVKCESNDSDEWLVAQKTPNGLIEADETASVAIYQLVRITKASAKTKIE